MQGRDERTGGELRSCQARTGLKLRGGRPLQRLPQVRLVRPFAVTGLLIVEL
jgi:hypothetical protein